MASFLTQIPTFRRGLRSIGRALWSLRRVALAGAGLFTAIVLLHNAVASHRWAEYRKEAAARGLALDLPKAQPRIPDSENFAAPGGPFAGHPPGTWLNDFSHMPVTLPDYAAGERMTTEKAYAKTAMGHYDAQEFLALCDRSFGKEWPAILEAELRPKTQRPLVSSPLKREQQLLPLTARKAAQIHGMRAMAYLDLGQHEQALNEVKGGLRIVRAYFADPDIDLVSYMIANAILALDISPVWEGMVDRKWTDTELLTLRDELAAIEPAKIWPEMIDSERRWENAALDELTAAPLSVRSDMVAQIFGKPENRFGKAFMSMSGILCTTGLIRDNQLASNSWWDSGTEMITPDGRWHPGATSFDYSLSHLSAVDRIRYRFAYIAAPSLARAACRAAVVEACLNHASLAVAIERYRRQHQDLPENISVLVPEFIAAVPLDPMGHPVKYSRESADAFRLDSMGDHGFPNECKVSDVWSGHPEDQKRNLVVWHGLAPESNDTVKTAAR